MRRWWLVIALLLSVGLNVGILAALAVRRGAPPPEPRGPQMPGKTPDIATPAGGDPLPRLPRLADRLGLEGEERRKFLDIQWNLYQQTSRLRLQLGEVHREIRKEMTRDEPDRRKLEPLLNESARIYLALERSMVNNVLATRELLGPEQERQYLALIGRLRIGGNAGAGPGFGGPGPGLGPAGQPKPPQRQGEAMRQRLREEQMEERMGDRMEQRRLRQERLRERFPRRFQQRPRRFEREGEETPEPPETPL